MKILDLHGVKYVDVPREIDKFIWENIQQDTVEIEFITGNSSSMDKIVRECISEYSDLEIIDDFIVKPTIKVKL